MKEEINNILEKLNVGDITTQEAIKQIRSIHIDLNPPRKKASKIKIMVIDEEQNIRLPAIPFWLLDLFIGMGLGLGSIALKFVNDIDEKTRTVLESISSRDLRKIFDEIKKSGPFEIIDIEDGDSTKIKISVL